MKTGISPKPMSTPQFEATCNQSGVSPDGYQYVGVNKALCRDFMKETTRSLEGDPLFQARPVCIECFVDTGSFAGVFRRNTHLLTGNISIQLRIGGRASSGYVNYGVIECCRSVLFVCVVAFGTRTPQHRFRHTQFHIPRYNGSHDCSRSGSSVVFADRKGPPENMRRERAVRQNFPRGLRPRTRNLFLR